MMITKKVIQDMAIDAGFHKYFVESNIDHIVYFANMIAELERE